MQALLGRPAIRGCTSMTRSGLAINVSAEQFVDRSAGTAIDDFRSPFGLELLTPVD